MCISPIPIPNPNYGRKVLAGDPFSMKDCTSKYIDVPCGHCDECVAKSQLALIQRVQMESLSNHVFFCTLTYNNDMIPYLDTSQGFRIRYTSVHDLQNMFKRLRNVLPFSFRYYAVSERGSEHARPHAHILFFVPKKDGDDFNVVLNYESILFKEVFTCWSRNIGSDKKPEYVPCCTYIRKFIRGRLKTTYDLHYVVPTLDDPSGLNVAFYVLKYMLKGSNHDVALQRALKLNYSDEEYRDTWNLVKSRSLCSKCFGVNPSKRVGSRGSLEFPDSRISDFIRNCIQDSKSSDFDYPCFFNTDSGKSFPLAKYYRDKFYSYEDALFFYFKGNRSDIDSPVITSEDNIINRDKVYHYLHDSKDRHSVIDELCDADLFDELFI